MLAARKAARARYWLAAADGGDATALKASQVDAIEDAFEAAGLVFTNGEEPR